MNIPPTSMWRNASPTLAAKAPPYTRMEITQPQRFPCQKPIRHTTNPMLVKATKGYQGSVCVMLVTEGRASTAKGKTAPKIMLQMPTNDMWNGLAACGEATVSADIDAI